MQTQIKVNGVIELDKGEIIHPENQYSLQCERLEYDQNKGYQSRMRDEEEIRTYKLENLGRVKLITEVKGKPYLIKGKAKKCTPSQILRLQIEGEGYDYSDVMNKIISKWKELI